MAVETPRCSGVRKQPVLAERTGLLRSVQWTTLCAIETKRSTGHRLSAEVKRLLALLAQKLVVSLNSRDGTHPNSGTGARFPAVEPGMLPRSDRTAIRRWSRHNRSCLPPSPGLQVATCAANQNRVWVKPSRELRDTTRFCARLPDADPGPAG